MSTTSNLVACLLGSSDEFAVLLAMLPDEFYWQDEIARETGWQRILHQINNGSRDLRALVNAAICDDLRQIAAPVL